MTVTLESMRPASANGGLIGLGGMSEEHLVRQLEAAEQKIGALKEELRIRQAQSSVVAAAAS